MLPNSALIGILLLEYIVLGSGILFGDRQFAPVYRSGLPDQRLNKSCKINKLLKKRVYNFYHK